MEQDEWGRISSEDASKLIAEAFEKLNLHAIAKVPMEADFTINQKPVNITVCCPKCYEHFDIPWDEVDVPQYWEDDWGEVECPYCGQRVKLRDWELD